MSDEIHAMGYHFGLWVTLWINLDADNYRSPSDHGYLLKSKTDPSQPCTRRPGGTARPASSTSATRTRRPGTSGQLHALRDQVRRRRLQVRHPLLRRDAAPPHPGYQRCDYVKLGAQLTDQFDQQGVGVRIHWTGSQKYGFVTREIDKGTGWDSLQAAVKQDMAVSTIGYPFVETDMIGGSDGDPPPAKEVLIRWAQAAAAMPLMYSSTSPLRIYNQCTSSRSTTTRRPSMLYTSGARRRTGGWRRTSSRQVHRARDDR